MAQLALTAGDASAGRLVGMAGGAVVYAGVAVGSRVQRAARASAAVAIAMACVPAAVIAAWAAGLPVPTVPDPAMLGVAALQWVAAAFAAVTLRGAARAERRAGGDPPA